MNKLSSAINSIADSLKTRQETFKPSEEQKEELAKSGFPTSQVATQVKPVETKKEESMKSFKELVERVVEETNKQLPKEGRLRIKEKVFKPKANPQSLVEIISEGKVVISESREGDTDADMDKTYGQLLKQMAVRGIIFTKAKFDSGEWNRS